MGFGARFLNQFISIRTLLAVLLLGLAWGGKPPKAVQYFIDAVDQQLLNVAVDYIEFPPPKTPITVIHVPDIEYEAWQSDITGAESLLHLLRKVPTENAAVAFLVEEPVRLIQGRAEKLLGLWAEDHRLNPKLLRTQVAQLQSERQEIIQLLQERVVLGIAGRASSDGVLVRAEYYRPDFLPQWAINHLWSNSFNQGYSVVTSSPLEHYLLPRVNQLVQPLIQGNEQGAQLTFAPRFLLAASSNHNKKPVWQQGQQLTLGGRSFAIGYGGGFVPLYGDAAGIKVPAVQLTLAAAQRMETLPGWVLIGRNGSSDLTAAAQTLAALGDEAYIVTPLLMPVIKAAVFLVLLLMVLFVLHRLSAIPVLLVGILLMVLLVAIQVLMPRVLGYWLPMGDALLTLAVVYLCMGGWRLKYFERLMARREREFWALQAANLHYQAGAYPQAAEAILQLPFSLLTLRPYYRIAKALSQGNQAELAQPLWAILYKKARKFKDVKEQTDACNKILHERIRRPQAPEKTQIICVETAMEKLGRYHVRQVLGHGGSGVVYLGFDPIITRDVALKAMNLNIFSASNQSKVKERFLAEVKTIGKLSHPNVVSVYDVGQEANWAYIAMDLARGQPLTDFIDRTTLLPVAEVYWIGLKVAEALAFAQQQNIVHCDIKPGNIIYDRETSDVKVTDFGIAKWLDAAHTETGEIMGSPLYMAPEQLQGRPVCTQTDIFSLGATLYQLLTAKAPFNGRSIAEIQQAVLYARPESVRALRPELPASTARIVNRALKKKTNERFSSASDMAFAINKAIIRDFKTEAKQWRLV